MIRRTGFFLETPLSVCVCLLSTQSTTTTTTTLYCIPGGEKINKLFYLFIFLLSVLFGRHVTAETTEKRNPTRISGLTNISHIKSPI